MEIKFELEEVVGLITKQPADFIANLKSDDGEWKSKDEIWAAIRKADKDRLDTIAKGESGKAVRLRMKKAQDFIKENFGVESDANEIEDHLKALVEKLGQPGKEKIVEKLVDLDENTALNHPVVKNLLKSEVAKSTAELNRQIEEKEKRYREFVEAETQKRLDNALLEGAAKVLTSIKAAVSKDDAIRKKQIKGFVAALKSSHKFKLDDSGNPVPVDANGDPLSENYIDVSFADLVKKENYFEVHAFDPEKSSPGATSQPTTNSQHRNIKVPTSQAEFQEALRQEKDSEKRKAITEAFIAAQEKK